MAFHPISGKNHMSKYYTTISLVATKKKKKSLPYLVLPANP